MEKDDKKITGSQESIQARLAALNAMMHKTPVPAPSEEIPEDTQENKNAESESTAEETAAEAADTSSDDVSVISAEADSAENATAEVVTEDNTNASNEATSAEEATTEVPGEAAPAEEAKAEEAASEVSAEATPAEETTAEVSAEEVSAEETTSEVSAEMTPAEEATAEVSGETTPTEEASSEAPAETAPAEEASSEAPAEAAPAEEASSEVPAEAAPAEEASSEAPAEAAPAEEASSEAPSETVPDEEATAEAPAEAASTEQKEAEAPAKDTAEQTSDKSAFMNTAALKERMAALMAGIQGTGANTSSVNATPASRQNSEYTSVPELIKNGFAALDQSDFESAKASFEEASKKDEKNGTAYFGQLLAYFNVKDTAEFLDLVMVRTRKNLPKKKVNPPIYQDFDNFVKNGCLCASEVSPQEMKILFRHLKAPYKSIVGGIDTVLEENKDLVEVYCDYMGEPAAPLYRAFKEHASEEELSSYDMNPAIRERLAQTKEEETARDSRRNSGEELKDILRQVDEAYDSLAGTGLSSALRIAAALQKSGHPGSIPFGHKPGENSPLAWIPVTTDGEKTLLMTKECVTFMIFGQTNKWADSEIRTWLNSTFYKDCFDDQERSLIHKETQENLSNTKFNAEGGLPTRDYVFVFSIKEAIQYFAEEGERACDEWYWLRSPGGGGNYVAAVEGSGRIDEYGSLMTLDSGGVRPAIWISFTGKAE